MEDFVRMVNTVVKERLPGVQHLDVSCDYDIATQAWICSIDGMYQGQWYVATEKATKKDVMLSCRSPMSLLREAFAKAADSFVSGIEALPQSDTPQIVENP